MEKSNQKKTRSNSKSNILIENNETDSSSQFTKKNREESYYSKNKFQTFDTEDKRNRSNSITPTFSPKNNQIKENSRTPKQFKNIKQRNTSKREVNKNLLDKKYNNDYLTTYNSNDTLDRFLNENYKNINLKKEYTDSFLKKNNDSYSKLETKGNLSISKNNSNSRTPRNITNSDKIISSPRNKDKNKTRGNSKELNNRTKRFSSTGKINKITCDLPKETLNKSNLLNTSKYSISSVSYYLDRRHMETVEKINNMRSEILKTEHNELREKPLISKKSLVLAEKLSNTSVFKRLTSGSQGRKRNEEIKLIERNCSKNFEKPRINDCSQFLTRTIDDLYDWKRKVDRKIESKYEEELNKISNKPILESSSEKILKQRVPNYLETKVEDRLLGKGQLYKIKLEENKKNYLDKVMQTPKNNKILLFPVGKNTDEITLKKDEFQKKYMNCSNASSPVNLYKTNYSTFNRNMNSTDISKKKDKLLEVRKSLNGYLNSKYLKEKFNNSNDDEIQNTYPENNDNTQNYIALTENNLNANRMCDSRYNNQAFKVIKYDSNNNNDIPTRNNCIIENKKENIPFSEIDKYDNLIQTDKPYNYFSNFNYNTSNYPPTVNQNPNIKFKKEQNIHQHVGQMKSSINEMNPHLFKKMEKNIFNTNNSINYLEEIMNKKLDDAKGYPSNIKLEENYQIQANEHNNSKQIQEEQELLQKSIENKKNLRSQCKPVTSGNNTTISNLTTIQKLENISKFNNSLIESFKNDISSLSNKQNAPLGDSSHNNKRKEVLNNFKTYLTEVETNNTQENIGNNNDCLKKPNEKDKIFKNEFDRNIHHIESVNERLKLNEESRKFIYSKMNFNNNHDHQSNLEIGAELEKFNRKK